MGLNSIGFDSVLDLCQHQHRRIVLGTLAAEQRSLTLNNLTRAVLKHNHQTPLTEVSEDVLTEIRLSLSHVHLPKLAAEGCINLDSERQLVTPTEQLDQVQPILAVDPALEEPMEL
nr:hypothetical protein [Natronorubrum halophilum]